MQKDYGDAHTYMIEIAEKYDKVKTKIDEIGDLDARPDTFYDTAKEAYEHRSNVDNLKKLLTSKEEELDPYTEQIDDLQSTAIQEISWDKINELNSYKDHQEFLYKLLTNKDSFIRKKIIEQNLAYLNNRLTHYLDKIGLIASVLLNDPSVEITTRTGFRL